MRTTDKRRQDIDDEEANAQLPNRRWVSAPSKITILIVAAAIAVFIFVASNLIVHHVDKNDEKPAIHTADNGIAFHRRETAPAPPPLYMPQLTAMPAVDAILPASSRATKPSTGALFAFTAADSSSETATQKPATEKGEERTQLTADDDPLTSSLKASNTGKTAKAHVLKHPRRVIARGTEIPCRLKTRINTSRPGLVVCDSKEEVRGWGGGSVMLLPRWTRFTGQISHGLTVDQDRVDVLWTSVLTPDNIEIAINSPAADMLGGPGVPGQVDNHIGEKIGAVLLYTVIEAGPALAVQALQNQSNNGSYSQYSYNQVYQPSQNVAGRLLEQKLQRPPILVKNQGEEVMIMVAQNWDLSDVIDLEPVR